MPDDTPVVECRGVRFAFGRHRVLDDVTFAVRRGAVYALLGRNGEGKSTLVRCLTGQLRPSAGTIRVFGQDPWRRRTAVLRRVGVVPEEPDAPPDLRVPAILTYVAGLQPGFDATAARHRLDALHVPLDRPFSRLSKGEKGAVMLALALGHAPDLLLLDDPTLGLDVLARDAVFAEVIGELADRGVTVLVTTHDLRLIEGVADRVGILRGGRLVLDDEVDAIKARFQRPLEEVFVDAVKGLEEVRA